MKTTVIYHSADFDGIFCREIARKFLPDAELIGWDFPDKPLDPITEGTVYILDLPIDRPFGYDFGKLPLGGPLLDELRSRIIWIDHHKSAIETHPTNILGYRIDGVAACRMAWQWFASNHHAKGQEVAWPLPDKNAFIDRIVSEPLAVRLAGEYDIWDKRDPNAEVFQFGLRSVDVGADFWEALMQMDGVGEKAVFELLQNGHLLQRYQQRNDASVMKHQSFTMPWEGLVFLCVNTARFNSLTFAALDVPETGHDALLGWSFNGKVNKVSLYHAKHNTGIDLSVIAKKYGGGGHKGACGFVCDKLPFLS